MPLEYRVEKSLVTDARRVKFSTTLIEYKIKIRL